MLYGDSTMNEVIPITCWEFDEDMAKAGINFPTGTYSYWKVFGRKFKEAYKDKVRNMLDYIQKGDIYEANFCQEFYAYGSIDPLKTYTHLNAISTPPFATFLKVDDHFLLSATPER